MEQNNSNPEIAQLKAEARKKLLYPAMALDFIAVIYFFVVNYAENQTGTTKVNMIFAAVYNSMGKIGGTLLFLGLGMMLVILFVVKMQNIKKMEQ
jgi:hypothetical protein